MTARPPDHMEDDGCDIAATCLECPLKECVYGSRSGTLVDDPLLRELVRQYDAEKVSTRKIAETLYMSTATVVRLRQAYRRIDDALRAAGQLIDDDELADTIPEPAEEADAPLPGPCQASHYKMRAPLPEIRPGITRSLTIFAR